MPEFAGPPPPVTLLPTDPDEMEALLPLRLLRSQILPPSPNRRKSAADWLPDFGGSSWLAYGSASLLVISHFPNPLYDHETRVGPFFQQVVEPSARQSAGDVPADVNAVRWCLKFPSEGEIAAAAGCCVWLYSPNARDDTSPFRWRQTAAILQPFTVEAIEWTGSGDGLVAAGNAVVLWIKKGVSWEMLWKCSTHVPQSMVSTSQFTQGPVATAACFSGFTEEFYAKRSSSVSSKECSYVSVYHGYDKTEIIKFELFHPQPVSMIQWRPFPVTQPSKDTTHLWRNVLLTCCLDGTVRLWSEIENGRNRKFNKETSSKRTYHVIAVIEINQCLKATLDVDVFISWGTEFGAVIFKAGDNYCSSPEVFGHDQVGKCEWLISVGPGPSLTFWAIHSLDEVSPLRFPRVTLWRTQDLLELKTSINSEVSNLKDRLFLVKAVVLRGQLSGPPVHCSVLQLLPDNSFQWLQLYRTTSTGRTNGSFNQFSKENSLSGFAIGNLNQDGHTGKIIQLDTLPYGCDVGLAVSLDSRGSLLFWSLPTISSCTLGTQVVIHPAWKLLGKVIPQGTSAFAKYSSLRLASSFLDGNYFLLLGHEDGIDCYEIQVSESGENVLCENILTIPFSSLEHEGAPDHIFTTSVTSTFGQSFLSNGFLLHVIWMKKFQAMSWKVVFHPEDSLLTSDPESAVNLKRNVVSFAGRKFYAAVDQCSSTFPGLDNQNKVTSLAVHVPDNQAISVQQCAVSYTGSKRNSCLYTMATGCSDGTVKLWRVSCTEGATHSKVEFFPWELVGMFNAHQGPVNALSLSSCGKIATVGTDCQNNTTSLHIWEPVSLIRGGNFLLEDVIYLTAAVVAVNWLITGNGQLLLGVCMPNELRVYSEKTLTDQYLAKSMKSKELNIWFCIAVSPVYPVCQGFCWGPKLTPVLIHDKHISLFSQWSSSGESRLIGGCSALFIGRTENNLPCTIYDESDTCDANKLLWKESDLENFHNTLDFDLKLHKKPYDFVSSGICSILDMSDKLQGYLPVYHPKSLVRYLYSGNWKHVFTVLRHLVESVKSDDASAVIFGSRKSESSPNVQEIQFSALFEETNSTSLSSGGLQWGQDMFTGMSNSGFQGNGDWNPVTRASNSFSTFILQKSEIMGFINDLERTHVVAGITDIEKAHVLALVDLLIEISDAGCCSMYESLDAPARRFWVGVRCQHFYFLRKCGRSVAAEELIISSELVSWAFQSECKDNLFDSVLPAEPSWLDMRNMGVGFWFTNTTQLRMKMEKLARSQYLKHKDPKDCALLYLALNRVQVLSGLFKISKDEKDKLLVAFLSRNFQEEKNKAAALKNAYVLMGRHQLELAIAFFLLGGDPSSAVTVCAKNLGDEQLALVICRLLEGLGGPLERHLITNFLLPSATERGDYWLSSMLEWTLGNYCRSLKNLIDVPVESRSNKTTTIANMAAFSDPTIGEFCSTLAVKNSLKNSIGDHQAVVLHKFVLLMTAIALKRRGLPFEALEVLNSSFRIVGENQTNFSDMGDLFHIILNPFSIGGASNWLLEAASCHLESNAKSELALRYISKLLSNHLNSQCANLTSFRKLILHEHDSHKDEAQIQKFKEKLKVVLSVFEQKYSLNPIDICEKIFALACNKGMLYHGYLLLESYLSGRHKTVSNCPDGFCSDPTLSRLLLKSNKEISHVLARHVAICNLVDATLESSYNSNSNYEKNHCGCFHPANFCLQNMLYSLAASRLLLKLYNGGILREKLSPKMFAVLDFLEYCSNIAFTWVRKDIKGLIMIVQPILNLSVDVKSSFEVIISDLMKILRSSSVSVVHDMSNNGVTSTADSHGEEEQRKVDSQVDFIAEDEVWLLIGASLWFRICNFAKHHLSNFTDTERHGDENIEMDLMNQFPFLVHNLAVTSLECISSYLSKQLKAFLRQKALKGLPIPSLSWLCGLDQSQGRPLNYDSNQRTGALPLTRNKDIDFLLSKLWESSVGPEDFVANNLDDRLNCLPHNVAKFPSSWQDMHRGMLAEYENGISGNHKTKTQNEAGLVHQNNVLKTDEMLETRRKDPTIQTDILSFHYPMEVFRRNGELIESICFNSTDEQEVAVASNRKGLLFFNWKANKPFQEQIEYIRSESDWPKDGWAGYESTPIPTFVSPGVGLGGERAHLGLGGATIGLGPLVRPRRDLTGGGAFGIPGYAGIGASGLSWVEKEDFTDYVDPPATIENIRSCALCSHPSMPFFLVGSTNTHVYLWEFGKNRALATYGVLPAANVPPPYAVASVSALKFDSYGHRFATAALDGTVCSWQLEVGGRNNVHPTESSLCFDNYASDVAYVGASGSILAAAGCSSKGVNIVMWDTLAPPATSQVSLACHESGALSLSVFDSGVGSGSVSPLIVTGGKGGDVGLHDFRYIATGKSKQHRQSGDQQLKSSAMQNLNSDAFKHGENVNGMLWYIPKAHSGSITRISTIPHTSFFLTGSKDGDVKLWDAKRLQLVFHWPKLHDKHTFFQPNTRGFGGVVRAAVTDVQVLSHGFLSCGGDGSVKLVQHR